MLAKRTKILPYFVLELYAKRNNEKMTICGMDAVVLFEDSFIKTKWK